MLAWQHSTGKRRVGGVVIGGGGGGDNAERMPGLPWRGLFSLSRATDEPQMEGQLLWVSGPGEAASPRGGVCVFRSWYAGQGGAAA